jgi:hypothetical protein
MLVQIIAFMVQITWDCGLEVRVSASQPREHGFEPYLGHVHISTALLSSKKTDSDKLPVFIKIKLISL